MSKSHRPWSPFQAYLLPPSPTEWLPAGHLAYFVLDVVEVLDVSAIERALAAKDPRGERPYAPRMMLALLIYGYSVGVFSSRRIAKATYEDVAFRVLAGGEHPHFTTVNEFRRQHGVAIAALFVQGLRLCEGAGLVKLGHVALDGAKILANASKHKAMSYERMQRDEARLQAEVEALLRRADEVDGLEDQQFGHGVAHDDVPEELRRRETRLARLREAKAALEAEARRARADELLAQARTQLVKTEDATLAEHERKRAATRARKAEQAARDVRGGDDDDDDDDSDSDSDSGSGGSGLPHHRVGTTPQGNPVPKAQRNFTDPDSRIMVKGGNYVQSYNAQIAVDGAAQVIVAHAVTNQPPDAEHLAPLLDRIEDNLGRAPQRASADTGYFSEGNVASCRARGVDPYISVGRQRHTTDAPHTSPWTTAAATAMRRKLDTPIGRATYARRKVIVEPVFGQIEEARRFRRFSRRGLDPVRHEWAFVCFVHNLLKAFRLAWRRSCPAAVAT